MTTIMMEIMAFDHYNDGNQETGKIICVENGVKRAKRSATKMHTSKKK